MVLRIVALELGAVGLGAAQPLDDLLDPLAGGEVVARRSSRARRRRRRARVRPRCRCGPCPPRSAPAPQPSARAISRTAATTESGRAQHVARGRSARPAARPGTSSRYGAAPRPRTGLDRLRIEIGVALGRIQRVMLDPHPRFGGSGPGPSSTTSTSVRRSSTTSSPCSSTRQSTSRALSCLQVVGAKQHPGHHRRGLDGAVQLDPRCVHPARSQVSWWQATYQSCDQRCPRGVRTLLGSSPAPRGHHYRNMSTTRNLVNLNPVAKELRRAHDPRGPHARDRRPRPHRRGRRQRPGEVDAARADRGVRDAGQRPAHAPRRAPNRRARPE